MKLFEKIANAVDKHVKFFEKIDMPKTGVLLLTTPFSLGILALTGAAVVLPTLVVAVGAAIGVVAAGEYGKVFVQKRVVRGDRNDAGQTVVGKVYDLKRLAAAQKKINAICTTFNAAADDADAFEKSIAEVVASVEPLRTKVQIFDAGASGAGNQKYVFAKTLNKKTSAVSLIN